MTQDPPGEVLVLADGAMGNVGVSSSSLMSVPGPQKSTNILEPCDTALSYFTFTVADVHAKVQQSGGVSLG